MDEVVGLSSICRDGDNGVKVFARVFREVFPDTGTANRERKQDCTFGSGARGECKVGVGG